MDRRRKQIIAAGGKAVIATGDVSDPATVENAVRAARALGGLHLLVNNAGIGWPKAPLGDYPLDGWKQVIDINLNAVFSGCVLAFLPSSSPEVARSSTWPRS